MTYKDWWDEVSSSIKWWFDGLQAAVASPNPRHLESIPRCHKPTGSDMVLQPQTAHYIKLHNPLRENFTAECTENATCEENFTKLFVTGTREDFMNDFVELFLAKSLLKMHKSASSLRGVSQPPPHTHTPHTQNSRIHHSLAMDWSNPAGDQTALPAFSMS